MLILHDTETDLAVDIELESLDWTLRPAHFFERYFMPAFARLLQEREDKGLALRPPARFMSVVLTESGRVAGLAAFRGRVPAGYVLLERYAFDIRANGLSYQYAAVPESGIHELVTDAKEGEIPPPHAWHRLEKEKVDGKE